MDIQGEVNSNTVTWGTLGLHLHQGQIRRNTNKETLALKDMLSPSALTDIYRTSLPKAEYTFLPSAHGTFAKIEHFLSNKISFNRFKRLKLYQTSFLTTTV